MRVLFDVVHPAHVHFFRHLHAQLAAEGHAVHVVSRDKEVTLELLDRFAIAHDPAGRAATGSMASRAIELVTRVRHLRRVIREFEPDVVLTRNPSGVQAAKLTGVTGVFDTDDGSAVGVHFRAARPFADVITTPACLREDYGAKHRRYPGFKVLAYLHPDRFRPDPEVRAALGIAADEPLYVVRFSAHDASHDAAISGLPDGAKRELVADLASRGHVVISDEGPLGAEFAEHGLTLPPDRLHDILAAADLCVGDSQTVAAEAAVLGTPAFRSSSFSGRVDYLRELEERYHLVHNYLPGDEERFLADVRAAAVDPAATAAAAVENRAVLLADSVDVTAWYRRLLDDLTGG
jgi:uncharacterized protein